MATQCMPAIRDKRPADKNGVRHACHLHAGRFHRIMTDVCVKEMQLYLSYVESEGTNFRVDKYTEPC